MLQTIKKKHTTKTDPKLECKNRCDLPEPEKFFGDFITQTGKRPDEQEQMQGSSKRLELMLNLQISAHALNTGL